MLEKIFSNKRRNEMICDRIEEILKEKDRQILVITCRINHINILHSMLTERGVDVGKICEKKRETEHRVILGNIQIVQEGFDLKTLNTLFVVTPKNSSVLKQKQIVGRILREQNQTIVPQYHDVFDYPLCYKNKKRFDGYLTLFRNVNLCLQETKA